MGSGPCRVGLCLGMWVEHMLTWVHCYWQVGAGQGVRPTPVPGPKSSKCAGLWACFV